MDGKGLFTCKKDNLRLVYGVDLQGKINTHAPLTVFCFPWLARCTRKLNHEN